MSQYSTSAVTTPPRGLDEYPCSPGDARCACGWGFALMGVTTCPHVHPQSGNPTVRFQHISRPGGLVEQDAEAFTRP